MSHNIFAGEKLERDMKETGEQANGGWFRTEALRWAAFRREREDQVFLVLTLVIGALVGLVVVAFIVLTERFGAHLDPAGVTPWRRLVVPTVGSLAMGYLLYRYFPDARGSGVPQTKAALYAREGKITLSTVFGKFFCTSLTLASGIPLGREGPAVQVGGGVVRTGRGGGRFARAGVGLGGAGIRNELGSVAAAARE